MNEEISTLYGQRVRVRVCGLCWKNNCLLMINHSGVNGRNFWAPPGGGVAFGETVIEALVREFTEETTITVNPGELKFVNEFLKEPLHAIELFFEVFYESGEIRTGNDPEMKNDNQIIQQVKWMTPEELKKLPKDDLHGIFKSCPEPGDIMKLSGYWRT